MTTKTWIYSDSIKPSDIEFLREIKVEVITMPEITTDINYGSNSYQMVLRSAEIHIITSCEKQELMLKLRWGDRVYFISQSYYQELSELRKIQNETMGQ